MMLLASFSPPVFAAAPKAPAPPADPALATLADTLLRDGRAALYLPFDALRSRFEPDAEKDLAAIAEIMKRRPKLRLVVEGHAVAMATPEQNMALSDARAQDVVNALLRLGVPAERLSFAAKGQTEPIIADAKTDLHDSRNERVELVDPDFAGVRSSRGLEASDVPHAKEPVLRRVPSYYISSFEEYQSWRGGRTARLGGLPLEGRASIITYRHPDADKPSGRLPAPAQILSQYRQAARKAGGYEVHRSTFDALYKLGATPEGETWLGVEVLNLSEYRVTVVQSPPTR